MNRISRRGVAVLAVVTIAVAVFWRTAYPTITWWDSSGYSLAAATFGVTSAPGSLLLTLLGSLVAQLPLALSPAHKLNLFAGVLGALAAALVYVVARRVVRYAARDGDGRTAENAAAFGAACGALTFAFSTTLWEHAIKFTPYVLTAVFTGLILWTMVRWWEDAERDDSWRWLALLALLFGLDFSVHRTNALMIPGAIAWILIRHPRAMWKPASWLAGAGGMAAGLSLQLAILPMSRLTQSPLNINEPNTWARLWEYISLSQHGGGFLIKLWPRNAGVWSVQIMDLVRIVGDNFLAIPAIAGVAGLAVLWRRNRRFGAAFTVVLLLQAATTVLYFNIPADYFRPFDRHYLPVFVTFGVAIACGLAAGMQFVAMAAPARRRVAMTAAGAAALVVPSMQLARNWSPMDASGRHFTGDYAANALEALPRNAIYFTVGDNDTFPVMYLQAAEGVRRDVQIVNLSLANASWYVAQIRQRDPSFPMSLTTDELQGAAAAREPLADRIVEDIARTNQGRRPLTFATSVGESSMGSLQQYARLDGLFWSIVPTAELRSGTSILRANLLQRYVYRGWADSSIGIDATSRTMAYQYYSALSTLLQSERQQNGAASCRDLSARFLAMMPLERLEMPPEVEAMLRCS